MSLFAKDRTWDFQKLFVNRVPRHDWWKGTKDIRLHLGCDKFFVPNWINVDFRDLGQDVVWDLNKFPWPFENESVSEIVAHNVFEHLDDINAVMKECHRIMNPGAKLFACVPHGFFKGYLQDPTHKRGFSFETFDYYTPKRPYGYFDFQFSSAHVDMWLPKGLQFWNWLIEPIINMNDLTKVFFEVTPLKVFLNGDLMVEMVK